nr:prepilin-type N-terminal cleavage/methylation domain-containing protein [Polaromonas sp. JS666]
MLTSAAGNSDIASIPVPARAAPGARARNLRNRGFTLLELLVVVAIMALATAGVTLALRDNAQTTLEREALRLAVLFESARAQSRANGVAVYWHATAEGFRFEGLPSEALPGRWLAEGTMVRGSPSVQLGPEPIIGPQAVELFSVSQSDRTLRVATDGLRPFTVQGPVQP